MAISESEWLSSTKEEDEGVEEGEQREDGSISDADLEENPPTHPVPTMQGAFEESMKETLEAEESEADNRFSKADSISRRKMLLEQERYERTVAGRWKQKPGEKFHPLWKLVAQISFGMHLLQQGLAKSDEEVIKILQTHVDEVDGFLERTTEDFDLAQGDINERIRYLRLPLEHGEVFDSMLNDRAFRIAIVEGNEKIEHIVDRTAAAMNDALKDVQKGLDGTKELARYLTTLDSTWRDRSEEHSSVYMAMIGNTEGWTRAFFNLQHKGNDLGVTLVQLSGIVSEMQRRAGMASRKNLVSSSHRFRFRIKLIANKNAVSAVHGKYYVESKPTSVKSSPRHTISPPQTPNKPLPRAPGSNAVISSSQDRHDNKSNRSSRDELLASKNTPMTSPNTRPNQKSGIVSRDEIPIDISKPSSRTSSKATTPALGTPALPADTSRRPKSPNKLTKSKSGISTARSMKSLKAASPQPHTEPSKTLSIPQPSVSPSLPPSAQRVMPIKSAIRRPSQPESTQQPPIPERPNHSLLSERTRSLTRKLSFFKDNDERDATNGTFCVCPPKDTPSENLTKNHDRPYSMAQDRGIRGTAVVAGSYVYKSGDKTHSPQFSDGETSTMPLQRPPSRSAETRGPSQMSMRERPSKENDLRGSSQTSISMPPSRDMELRNGPQMPIQSPPIHELEVQGPSPVSMDKPPLQEPDRKGPPPLSLLQKPYGKRISPPDFPNQKRPKHEGDILFLPMLSSTSTQPVISPLPEMSPFAVPSPSQINLEPQTRKEDRTDAKLPTSRKNMSKTPPMEAASKNDTPKPKDRTTVLIAMHEDAEGSVNLAHPLLRDTRFSRFAPGVPIRTTTRDLPLRHYRSQEVLPSLNSALSDPVKGPVPPKRTSSLRNSANMQFSPINLNSPLTSTLSPAPAESSAKPSPLHFQDRSKTEPDTRPTPPHTPSTSTVGSDSAIPPPITRNSLPPGLSSSLPATPKSPKSPEQAQSPIRSPIKSPRTNRPPPVSVPNNQTYELSATVQNFTNPASSTALIEFLAASPPSTPHPPQTAASTYSAYSSATSASDIYRRNHSEPSSSPAPPAPGGVAMVPRNTVREEARALERRGWKKKVFGAGHRRTKSGKGIQSEMEDASEGRKKRQRVPGIVGPEIGGGESGFMGVGKDGVWISRKNFLKA